MRTGGLRWPGLALAIAAVMVLGGCDVFGATGIPGGGGGQGGNHDGSVVDDGSADGVDDSDDREGEDTSAVSPSVGTIAVKVERPPAAPRLFHFEASECLVSQPRIRGVGNGTEDGTGSAAMIDIDTAPGSLEHEKTGTWQASGAIRLTIGTEVVVSDGRLETVGSHVQPSMFMSRISGNSVKYVVAWFFANGTTSAGAVEMTCK